MALPNLSALTTSTDLFKRLTLSDWQKSEPCCFIYRNETTYGPYKFQGCLPFFCRVVSFSTQQPTAERAKITKIENFEI